MRYTGRRNDRLISHESEEKGIAPSSLEENPSLIGTKVPLIFRWTLLPIREGFYKPL
jgi:hypothetical protein